jgi:hypothetical protein
MGGFFICYRRGDAPAETGRLHDALVHQFGSRLVFRDINSLEPGAEWREEIGRRIADSDALIVVIGRKWLSAEKDGHSRLFDPNDPVRREIRTGMTNGVKIVPALVDGASMPPAKDLPEELAGLRGFNAQKLEDPHYSQDVSRLIAVLKKARQGRTAQRLFRLSKSPAGPTAAALRLLYSAAALSAILLAALGFILVPKLLHLRPTTAAERYQPAAQEHFEHGRYAEVLSVVETWLKEDPQNATAHSLRSVAGELNGTVGNIDTGIRLGDYTRAHNALARLQRLNKLDPRLPALVERVETTFSPEIQDEFLGGVDLWTAPKSWHADRGMLTVRGTALGVLRGKHYDDFTSSFNISFLNSRGAAWILRAEDNLSRYYLFQLNGPKGTPANSFAGFKVTDGRKEAILGPIAVGADLGRKDDQFNITVKAAEDRIDHFIEMVSDPSEGPRLLGSVTDPAFAGGTFGFGVTGDEEFSVRAFKIIPIRKDSRSN